MSNIINSSVLTMNSGRGYNPYRDADGKFASGPVAVGRDAFRAFADRDYQEETNPGTKQSAVGAVKTALNGMLRMGVNLKNDSGYLDKVSAASSSSITKKIKKAQEAYGEFDNRTFGETLTNIYDQISPVAFKVSKSIDSGKPVAKTVTNKLQTLSKQFNAKTKEFERVSRASIYNELRAEVYGYATAMANTLIAVATE